MVATSRSGNAAASLGPELAAAATLVVAHRYLTLGSALTGAEGTLSYS